MLTIKSLMASTKVFVSRLQRSFTSQAIHAAIAQAAKKMGYSAPRSEQLEAVENFVSGRDVFLSLPTGGGKSFCFACLPLVFDFLRGAQQQSIVLVVSPLIALMQDQVASLTSKGIKAAYVQGEGGDNAASVSDGEIQVVYMSPETLLTVPKWREMLRQELYQDNVVGLAVDEAHLVEKWYACVCTWTCHCVRKCVCMCVFVSMHVNGCVSLSVTVCACVYVYEKEGMCVCVHTRVCVRVHHCMCMDVCVCVVYK